MVELDLNDTHPKVRAKLDDLYRTLDPARKLEIVFRLSQAVDEVALVGIHERHPGCSEHEARMRLAAMKYGRELVAKAYGWSAANGDRR